MTRTHEEESKAMARFEQELRELAARTPRLDPATAATKVAARLGERATPRPRRQLRLAWGLAAASAALVVAVIGLTGGQNAGRTRWTLPPAIALSASPPSTLGSGQVLIWLDERTPLYMNFAPPGGGTDSGGGS